MSLKERKQYLDSCSDIARSLYNQGLFDDCTDYIQKIANYAWWNFTGYYTAYDLEDILRKIATEKLKYDPISGQTEVTNKERNVLHVFSEVSEIGGHTKLLENWVVNDGYSNHYLLSTRQDKDTVKRILKEEVSSEVTIYSLTSSGNISKAQDMLNIISEGQLDAIILHIHPDDVIPVLALNVANFDIPVLFLNHADHIFWLGVSVIDYLIQIRKPVMEMDAHRRGILVERQLFLPIPVNVLHHGKTLKDRSRFSILSTGSSYKYRPNKDYNFFREVKKIVERYEHVDVYIAGVSDTDPYFQEYAHPNIKCLGAVTNLHEYEDLADLYLEGFPMPSYTALLQAALKEVPFVLHYNPTDCFKLFEEERAFDVVYPRNVEEWHQNVDLLLKDKEAISVTGLKQYEYIHQEYSKAAWLDSLMYIYKAVEQWTADSKKNGIKKDVWLQTKNEEILYDMSTLSVDHLKFLYKLRFTTKLKVLLNYFTKERESMVKLNFKEIIYFLIKKS